MDTSDERRKKLINAMFRVRAGEFARCFSPDMTCERPAIRAHSVQNAGVLDLLSVDGHVVTPTLRLDASSGPSIEFSDVGRNRATTFSGLCGKHDREIFAPVELGPLDLASAEHRFLLAFRAAFYEVHATAAAAVQVQTLYQERVKLGADAKEEPSPAGVFAVQRMFVAYETFMYKSDLDRAYLNKNWQAMQHDLVELEVGSPTLAASVLFDLPAEPGSDESLRICLSIVPISVHRTVALLSYRNADAVAARAALRRILDASGDHQKYELSRRLLNHAQNFVLSPAYVRAWTARKRTVIVDYVRRTVLRNDMDFEDPDLMLFN